MHLGTAYVGPWFQVSPRAGTSCLIGLESHLKAHLGKDLLPSASGYWGTQFLGGYWLETALSSLPNGSPHCGGLLHQVSKKERRETASNMELTILCDIIWK